MKKNKKYLLLAILSYLLGCISQAFVLVNELRSDDITFYHYARFIFLSLTALLLFVWSFRRVVNPKK